jgi:hypothetical protein
MSDAYGSVHNLREVCRGIRPSIAGVLDLAGAAQARADLPEDARSCLEQIMMLAECQSDVVDSWPESSTGSPQAP